MNHQELNPQEKALRKLLEFILVPLDLSNRSISIPSKIINNLITLKSFVNKDYVNYLSNCVLLLLILKMSDIVQKLGDSYNF